MMMVESAVREFELSCSFEHSLAELEGVVHDLEEGQLGLAESLARYEQGVKHLKHCYELLEASERKIELLTGVDDDGQPRTEPLDEPAEPLAESAGRRRRAKASRSPPRTEGTDASAGNANASSTDDAGER